LLQTASCAQLEMDFAALEGYRIDAVKAGRGVGIAIRLE
jgi:hypothetical protein